jgi:hypothetical protein
VPIISVSDLWDALVGAFGKQTAQVIAGVIILLVGYFLRQIWRLVRWMVGYYRRLEHARGNVARVRTPMGMREGRGLWISDNPISPPKSYAKPALMQDGSSSWRTRREAWARLRCVRA